MEQQNDHSQDQSEAHGGYRERTDRGKDKNPERTPASREQRKGLDGQKTLKDYNINGGETIEMTALLLGGTKNKSLSPTSMNVGRETKRKDSEPYIDVSGLEEKKFESAASEEETVIKKQWMKSMMKEMKDCTDDISEFEKTMTGMIFEMTEVKVSMNKMSDAFSNIVDESQRRDQRFEELWIRINEDIRTREQRTEARIAGIEKHIDAKIEEKFTDLEARMGAVEKIRSKRKDLP